MIPRWLTTLSILVLAVAVGSHLATSHRMDRIMARQAELDANLARLVDQIDQAATVDARFGRTRDESLRDEISRLSQTVKGLQSAQAQNAAADAPLDSAADRHGLGYDLATESAAVESAVAEHQPELPASRRFLHEAADASWVAGAELSLSSALYDRLPGGSVTHTECRSTICKVEMRFDSVEDQREQTAQLPFMLPWAAQSHISLSPDGTASLYVAREGYSLESGQLEGVP